MSEPIQGTPAPANNPQGTGITPEQPPIQTPNPAPSQQATPPVATPTAPDTAALQARLEQAERAARYHQSQHSQARQQLQAVTGVQPQVDPVNERAKRYVELGMHADDAPQFAKIFQAELAPLQQENNQLRAQLQGSSIAQQVMQAAVDANPELFADGKVAAYAWNELQRTAQAGNLQALTPEYAKHLGALAWSEAREPWKNPNPQPPAPQPMPGFRPAGLPPISFGGSPGQYPPPAAFNAAPDPKVAALAAEMAKYTGIPLAQQ